MNIWASLWSTKLIYVVDCRKRGGRWNIIMKEIEASWWQLVTINQLKYNVSFWMSLLKNIACICKVSWSVCCACDRCEKIGDDLVSKMAMSVSITCRGAIVSNWLLRWFYSAWLHSVILQLCHTLPDISSSGIEWVILVCWSQPYNINHYFVNRFLITE